MSGGEQRPEKVCIYPGCTRPAVAPHLLGGPQPSFCDLEEHNALRAHQERQRLAGTGEDEGDGEGEGEGEGEGQQDRATDRDPGGSRHG